MHSRPCALPRWPLLLMALLAGCSKPPPPPSPAAPAPTRPGKQLVNREAPIPSQCYTKTEGVANPCWTCHTSRNGRNFKGDWELQEQYAFSDVGLVNHWSNLHVDRRKAVAAISDAEILGYIRGDNYSPLRAALATRKDVFGYRPDLDYARGFDAEGFARDGSGWRAFIYKPFLGTFWPTNGATDDVLIRLPAAFRSDAAGQPSQAIYKANLAILEAAITVADTVADAALERRVEPLDEQALGTDLDGNGRRGRTEHIRGLPAHYLGAAAALPVVRWSYPVGTEFLHSVRYVDPDAPNLLSARMKELRYAAKRLDYDEFAVRYAYKEQADEKAVGKLPYFRGTAEAGLLNDFGWVYQGWIEDAGGALRQQSYEESYYCMGCHNGIGITADSSFGFPRKVPGARGWGWQNLAGIPDVPQAGHEQGEILTYLQRVGGGDEFRNNGEMLARFFPQGELDEAKVKAASDIRALITPSRERALLLDKSYRALVQSQDFIHGRDTVVTPAVKVLDRVRNGDTELKAKDRVYSDGRIWLAWPQ